jgi:hypothetical protein
MFVIVSELPTNKLIIIDSDFLKKTKKATNYVFKILFILNPRQINSPEYKNESGKQVDTRELEKILSGDCY